MVAFVDKVDDGEVNAVVNVTKILKVSHVVTMVHVDQVNVDGEQGGGYNVVSTVSECQKINEVVLRTIRGRFACLNTCSKWERDSCGVKEGCKVYADLDRRTTVLNPWTWYGR